jgi:hypothetical protein
MVYASKQLLIGVLDSIAYARESVMNCPVVEKIGDRSPLIAEHDIGDI